MNQRHILVCGIIFADKDILKFFKIHFFTVADIFERESPKKKSGPACLFRGLGSLICHLVGHLRYFGDKSESSRQLLAETLMA